jgi:hypothetical protein
MKIVLAVRLACMSVIEWHVISNCIRYARVTRGMSTRIGRELERLPTSRWRATKTCRTSAEFPAITGSQDSCAFAAVIPRDFQAVDV